MLARDFRTSSVQHSCFNAGGLTVMNHHAECDTIHQHKTRTQETVDSKNSAVCLPVLQGPPLAPAS